MNELFIDITDVKLIVMLMMICVSIALSLTYTILLYHGAYIVMLIVDNDIYHTDSHDDRDDNYGHYDSDVYHYFILS